MVWQCWIFHSFPQENEKNNRAVIIGVKLMTAALASVYSEIIYLKEFHMRNSKLWGIPGICLVFGLVLAACPQEFEEKPVEIQNAATPVITTQPAHSGHAFREALIKSTKQAILTPWKSNKPSPTWNTLSASG
jgi:hypothetical protein